jgi:ssDNA-binding Zn-finger/Zn-ribbon topoisomerase 1
MTWKDYFTQKCPHCKGRAYKRGRQKGYQRYACSNYKCGKWFDERDLAKPLTYLD